MNSDKIRTDVKNSVNDYVNDSTDSVWISVSGSVWDSVRRSVCDSVLASVDESKNNIDIFVDDFLNNYEF